MRPHHAGTFTRSEAEALRLWDLGYSKQRIARETEIDIVIIDRAVGWTSEHDTRAMHRNTRTGSAQLLAALKREGMAA